MFVEERAAADLVAALRNARLVNNHSGDHDAELVLPSGWTIGLEVTRAIDPEEARAWAAIRQHRTTSSSLLRNYWSVGLEPGASVKAAHRVVPPLLAELERLGETEHRWVKNPFGSPNEQAEVRAIEIQLADVRVDHAASWLSAVGGYSFVPQKPGGAISGQSVLDVIEREVFKADNLSKLDAMNTDERHLFIWIDHTESGAHSVMMFRPISISVPQLPNSVSTLWVAARTSTAAGEDWIPAGLSSITPPDGWLLH